MFTFYLSFPHRTNVTRAPTKPLVHAPRTSYERGLPARFCIASWYQQQLKDGPVASCGEDMSIIFWDVATEAVLQVVQGHDGDVFGLAQLEDRRIVSGGEDPAIHVWSTMSYTVGPQID